MDFLLVPVRSGLFFWWYKSAFKSLLDFVHVTFGPRNSVEPWFRTVKERTKHFWNNFRSKDWRIHRLVFPFAFWYNFAGIILGSVGHLVMLLNGSRR